MMSYDWISVPLVYTQVVTLATYMYATALMIGRQYLDTSKGYEKHQVDLYIPFFTIMQFFFYVGWLKVAEQIVNPYGEDDDDFELNWCLDRTVHVVYLIVDHLQTKHPKIRKDYFWDEMEPKLPQTKHSAKGIENPHLGSAFNLEVEEAEYLRMDTFLEEDKEENMYTSDSVRQRDMNGFRSSFIIRMLNPGFGQSFRKKSVQTDDIFKNTLQSRGYTNTAFVSNNDKSSLSTPAISRKSSFRSFIKKLSPSNSRTSSISLRPGSLNRRKFKSYDFQDSEKVAQVNGSFTEQDNSVTLENGQPRLSTVLSVGQLEDRGIENEEEKNVETDNGGTRLEILMPPIPEEPSRATSFVSVDCEATENREPLSETDPVQNFVKEANEVLKELNKTISAQGHRQDYELKGYESCCSITSDMSDDSNDSNDVNQKSYKSNELKEILHDNVSLNV